MKLEIGGYNKKLQGEWIRLNHKDREKHDINIDINTDKFPWNDNTFDEIYMSMVIEHIPLNILYKHTLPEIHRILKPRGFIRLVTPNLEELAKSYVNKEKTPFYTNKVISIDKLRREIGIGSAFVGTIVSNGNDTYLYSRDKKTKLTGLAHINSFDYESLKNLLLKTGFTNVLKSQYNHLIDNERYDNKWCLFVEAYK